jgi:predicted phage gp36 major capsid-like protein
VPQGWDGLGDIERKVLQAGTGGSPDPQGWQTIPETFLRELQRNLVEFSPMRQVARVQQVSGSPVKLPKRLSNLTAGWVAETVEHSISEPTYGQQEIPVFEARVSTEVTNQLLEDSAFDLAAELSRTLYALDQSPKAMTISAGDPATCKSGISRTGRPSNEGGLPGCNDSVQRYTPVPDVFSLRTLPIVSRRISQVPRLE